MKNQIDLVSLVLIVCIGLLLFAFVTECNTQLDEKIEKECRETPSLEWCDDFYNHGGKR